ncbi:ribokinase [Roseateles sp.]|uniref:ribokinase n=1 Tax=Roseateles sp. TaxID=1971397 RepID=UPI003D0B99B0
MTAARSVTVVGSLNIDMLAHSERLPEPGETLVGERFVMTPGGKGANQAVAAARLGACTAFLSRVGTRQYGGDLLQALEGEGIDCRAVHRDPEALPGIAVIMVASRDGENAIVYVPGSNAQLSTTDVQAARAQLQASAVVVAQLEVPVPAILAAFEIARAAGAITVLNAAPALTVPAELLALSDWLVVNETEALLMAAGDASLDVAAAAECLRGRGPAQVLVSLGAKGALLCNAEGQVLLPAQAVKAVETVGAGDTLVGGLAAALAEGQGAQAAVRLGQAAAALAVSRPGVQDAMPRRAELGAAFAPL